MVASAIQHSIEPFLLDHPVEHECTLLKLCDFVRKGLDCILGQFVRGDISFSHQIRMRLARRFSTEFVVNRVTKIARGWGDDYLSAQGQETANAPAPFLGRAPIRFAHDEVDQVPIGFYHSSTGSLSD